MNLIEHLEEYEDTENRGDIFVEGELPDGTKVEFHFYHAMGEKPYTVEVYQDGEKIGQLWEGI